MISFLALSLFFALAIGLGVYVYVREERIAERQRIKDVEFMDAMQRLWDRQQQTIEDLASKVQSPDARISAALYGEYQTTREQVRQDQQEEEWLRSPESEIPMADEDLNAFSAILPVEND